MNKVLALLGMFVLAAAVVPGVYAEGDLSDSEATVKILDDVHYLEGELTS